MAKPTEPIFLARDSYRRRRVADAARLVPVMGLILLLLPGLWTTTAGSMIYIFSVWAILIVVIGAMSSRLGRITATGDEANDSQRDPPPGK